MVLVDGLLTGGWAELSAVMKLGPGGALAAQMETMGLRWAVTGGAAGAYSLVTELQQMTTVVPGLLDGTYWEDKKTSVQVGSL